MKKINKIRYFFLLTGFISVITYILTNTSIPFKTLWNLNILIGSRKEKIKRIFLPYQVINEQDQNDERKKILLESISPLLQEYELTNPLVLL